MRPERTAKAGLSSTHEPPYMRLFLTFAVRNRHEILRYSWSVDIENGAVATGRILST